MKPEDTYQISYQDACPDKVYVFITRNGKSVHCKTYHRKRDNLPLAETVDSMMARAKRESQEWVDDDRRARNLERQFNQAKRGK